MCRANHNAKFRTITVSHRIYLSCFKLVVPIAAYHCWNTLFDFNYAHLHSVFLSHIQDVLSEKVYKAYFRNYNISLEDSSGSKLCKLVRAIKRYGQVSSCTRPKRSSIISFRQHACRHEWQCFILGTGRGGQFVPSSELYSCFCR
jgi:hypothetical protein